jgi:site-specific DNA-cytosine methylase
MDSVFGWTSDNEKELKKYLFLKELELIKPYPIKGIDSFLQGKEVSDEILEKIIRKLCNNRKRFFEVSIGRFDKEIEDISKFLKKYNFKKEQKIRVLSKVIEWITEFPLEKKEMDSIKNFFNENEFTEKDKKQVFKKVIEKKKEEISTGISTVSSLFDISDRSADYLFARHTLSEISHNLTILRNIPEFKEEFRKKYNSLKETAKVLLRKLIEEWNNLEDEEKKLAKDLIVAFDVDEYLIKLFG